MHIYQQQRQPVLAVDTLLNDVLGWKPARIPEAYIQMLIKSCLNLAHCDKISQLVDKSEHLSAVTYFAYIEMLQQFKLHEQVPSVIENMLSREPDNKQVQAMYLEIVSKVDLHKAIALQ